jgi:hypothetical protein
VLLKEGGIGNKKNKEIPGVFSTHRIFNTTVAWCIPGRLIQGLNNNIFLIYKIYHIKKTFNQ